MSPDYNIYRFDNFELNGKRRLLSSKQSQIDLTPSEYSLLIFFLQHPKTPQMYADLYEEIFGLEGKSQQNSVPAHISNLRKKLRPFSQKEVIKNHSNFGYEFIAEVIVETVLEEERSENPTTIRSESEKHILEIPPDYFTRSVEISQDNETLSQSENRNTRILGIAVSGIFFSLLFFALSVYFLSCRENCFEKNVFIIIASSSYGLLTGIVLLLECAYEFDKYIWNSTKIAPAIILVNAAAIFLAFSLTEKFLQNNSSVGFFIGLGCLLVGALISSKIAHFVLPNTPIAKATFQTQPAFSAFLKNLFIYSFSLYTFFGLFIFYLIYGNINLTKSVGFPAFFSGLWIIICLYSHLSTNYLADNLLIEKEGKIFKYHGLYTSLLVIRAFFFFAPTGGFIIWYFTKTI